MSPSTAVGRRRAARAIIALAAVTACLGAVVAYAATRSGGGKHGNGGGKVTKARHRERLLTPQLLETPPMSSSEDEPQFRFNVPPREPPEQSPEGGAGTEPATARRGSTRDFECRVDRDEWSACSSPYRPAALGPGSHRFAVRVYNREERVGETVDYSWQQIAATQAEAPQQPTPTPPPPAPVEEPVPPKGFTIEALEEPEGLYPGLPPHPIPVRIGNPNPVPIEITSLTVAIGVAPDACAAENFELTPAGVSPEAPLTVPAEGSVDLPAAEVAAPSIQMLNLPVNQDACQELPIPLVFGGEAHG